MLPPAVVVDAAASDGPMGFLIKICGLTTPADVEMVTRAGADAIGVNFWKGSKRFVGGAAAEVVGAAPPGVLKFGVFVNASPAYVEECVGRFGLDRVQLHGDERAADFAAFPSHTVVRAIRVKNAQSLAEAAAWRVDLFLYDAFVEGYGGGGTPAPWAEIGADGVRGPFLLAGGLDPRNIGLAIRSTRPAGVDVASGVESSPGRKDRERTEAFIRAARAAVAGLALPRG